MLFLKKPVCTDNLSLTPKIFIERSVRYYISKKNCNLIVYQLMSDHEDLRTRMLPCIIFHFRLILKKSNVKLLPSWGHFAAFYTKLDSPICLRKNVNIEMDSWLPLHQGSIVARYTLMIFLSNILTYYNITLYFNTDQASDMCQKLEQASEIESDLRYCRAGQEKPS